MTTRPRSTPTTTTPPLVVPPADAHVTHGSARCSLWWTRPPYVEDHTTGFIGHFDARTAADAHVLLRRATEQLRENGCSLAVGPVNGSTFGRYRLITDRAPGGGPPAPSFTLEPDAPNRYRHDFEQAGFTPWQHYASVRAPNLENAVDPGALPVEGLTLRTINGSSMEEELKRLFPFITGCFRNNPLFTELAEHEFMALHRPMLRAVDPELVWVLEKGSVPTGFLLMLPNRAEGARDSVILKTLCLAPELRGHGLGRWMVNHALRTAKRRGCREVIFALMHERNPSLRIALRHGHVMRRYAVFARALSGTLPDLDG